MSISIQKYTKSNEQSWDEFVLSSSNGTIFHLRSFLSYHIDRKFEDHSLIFKKNNSIIAIFPAVKIKNKNVHILHSHPGASYGGFVYNNLSYEEGDEIIQAMYKYCKKNLFHKIYSSVCFLFVQLSCHIPAMNLQRLSMDYYLSKDSILRILLL